MSEHVRALATRAKEAAAVVADLPTHAKDAFLRDLADRISTRRDEVLDANAQDLTAARDAGLPPAKIQRLELSPRLFAQLSDGLRQVASLPDPVGAEVRSWRTESGLDVRRVRTPLGVICMIFEARPFVTIDAFSLCLKSGNACILKGGKEAARSASALATIAREALVAHGLPPDALVSISDSSRDAVRELLTLDGLIDLVIPRGGADLIRFVREHSKVPTVQHAMGVCHVYVDASADIEEAVRITLSAKTSAPATCNSAECVLVHQDAAPAFVPAFARACLDAGVTLRAEPAFRALAPESQPAHDTDFGHEFLDRVMAAKVVGSLDDAIAHIRRFGSDHTEAILTRDAASAEAFCRRVRSSCVVVNASTRFNDGYQLGLGAEIGISTSRIHAFGPMGLEELTIPRFVVRGAGQTR